MTAIDQISQSRHTVIDEKIGKAKIVANEYSSAYFTDYLKRYLQQSYNDGLMPLIDTRFREVLKLLK